MNFQKFFLIGLLLLSNEHALAAAEKTPQQLRTFLTKKLGFSKDFSDTELDLIKKQFVSIMPTSREEVLAAITPQAEADARLVEAARKEAEDAKAAQRVAEKKLSDIEAQRNELLRVAGVGTLVETVRRYDEAVKALQDQYAAKLEMEKRTSYYAGKFSRAFGEGFDPDTFIQALATAGVDWADNNAVQKAGIAFLVQSVFSYALSAFKTDDEALTLLTDRGVSCEKSQEENGKIVHSVRKDAVIKYVEDLLEEGLVTIDLSVFRDRREFVDLAIRCGLAPRSEKPLPETLEGMGRVAQIKYGGELYDTYEAQSHITRENFMKQTVAKGLKRGLSAEDRDRILQEISATFGR